MKRSKVFLALTGGILAIVGMASARAHRTALQVGYFTNPSTNKCTSQSLKTGYTVSQGSGNVVTTLVGSRHANLYSKPITSGICSGNVLYTQTAE